MAAGSVGESEGEGEGEGGGWECGGPLAAATVSRGVRLREGGWRRPSALRKEVWLAPSVCQRNAAACASERAR